MRAFAALICGWMSVLAFSGAPTPAASAAPKPKPKQVQQGRLVLNSSNPALTPFSVFIFTLDVRAPAPKVVSVEGSFAGKKIPFFHPSDTATSRWVALAASPYKPLNNPQKLEVTAQTESGSESIALPFEPLDAASFAPTPIPTKAPPNSEKIKVDDSAPQNSAIQQRILAEGLRMKAVLEQVTPEKRWRGPFQFPIKARITSPYRAIRWVNGKRSRFHYGLDIRAKIGTPVHACARGKVAFVGNVAGLGNAVVIDHGYGLFSIYGHLSRALVSEGKIVDHADEIALSGESGQVTAPHLHWGISLYHVLVNPIDFTHLPF